MSYPAPPRTTAFRVRRILWIVSAVLAWTINPLVVLITLWPTGIGRDCASPPGRPDIVPSGCPREGLIWLSGVMMLGFWVLLTAFVGFALGVVEGVHRRFAKDNVVAAVLTTVVAPWAMLGFVVGASFGLIVAGVVERGQDRRAVRSG